MTLLVGPQASSHLVAVKINETSVSLSLSATRLMRVTGFSMVD